MKAASPSLAPVRFISHGCVCFDSGGFIVTVDPFRLPEKAPAADLIIITHSHADHYSPKDIRRICKPDTQFIATAQTAALLEKDLGVPPARVLVCAAGGARMETACGAAVTPVAAVNKNHPAGFGFGVILAFAGFTYYLSGDTDTLAPDVPCDVLFVVCDGHWNMPRYEEAVPAQLAAMRVRPGLVVPYHYGSYLPGSKKNGGKLCAALTKAGFACEELEIL